MRRRVTEDEVTRGRKNPLHFGLPMRLKAARKNAGLPRARLAREAGLSVNAASYIEVEHRIPGVDTVEKLARVLHVSPCWLAFNQAQPLPASGLSTAAASYDDLRIRLLLARQVRGLSQNALAVEAGITHTAVLLIEDGRNLPSVDTVERLAGVLSVSPCWLAYGQGEDPFPSETSDIIPNMALNEADTGRSSLTRPFIEGGGTRT